MLKKVLIYIENQKLLPESELVRIQLAEKAETVIEETGQKADQPDLSAYLHEGLIITDSEEMAQDCLLNQLPALVCLHEYNKDSSFPGILYAVEDLKAVSYVYLNRIYDRCHGNPWTILETERCNVREMTVEDTPAIYNIYAGKAAARYLEKLPLKQEEYKEYINNYIAYGYSFYEYGMWVVEEKGSRKVIGRAGIEWKEDVEGAELGYVMEEAKQGCGLAYEVCRAIVDYAVSELGFTALYIIMEESNIASRGLACKLGFALERTLVRQNKICQVYKYHCTKSTERIE